MNIRYSTEAKEGLRPIVNVDRDALEAALASKQPTARELSGRQELRARRADSAATGKKSRHNAARQKFHQRHTEQSLRGMARVHLLHTGTPAMQRNVRREVFRMASATGDFETGLREIEGMLRDILVAYGDVDE